MVGQARASQLPRKEPKALCRDKGVTANLLELITYVQLVRIKEQQDEVASRSKPAAHIDEVVGALDALLLA